MSYSLLTALILKITIFSTSTCNIFLTVCPQEYLLAAKLGSIIVPHLLLSYLHEFLHFFSELITAAEEESYQPAAAVEEPYQLAAAEEERHHIAVVQEEAIQEAIAMSPGATAVQDVLVERHERTELDESTANGKPIVLEVSEARKFRFCHESMHQSAEGLRQRPVPSCLCSLHSCGLSYCSC